MKKAICSGAFSILICMLFYSVVSYGGTVAEMKALIRPGINFLLQDSTAKKGSASKGAQKDRTKGEAGQGQGRGTDTLRKGTQETDSIMNKGAQQKNDQNSDNRGDGSNKNNRAGNKKEKSREADSTRQ